MPDLINRKDMENAIYERIDELDKNTQSLLERVAENRGKISELYNIISILDLIPSVDITGE